MKTLRLAALAVGASSLLACSRSDTPALGDAGPPAERTNRVPADYVFIERQGAVAHAQPPGVRDVSPGKPLGGGFGFVVTQRRNVEGRNYLRLGEAGWVPAEQTQPVRASTFAGVLVPRGVPLNVAWVVAPEAVVRAAPDATARALVTRPAHTRLTLAGRCRDGWCPLAVGWLRASDLAQATQTERPPRVGPAARWLDVDLTSQLLVAYEGDRPVFATLVSTGIGQEGSPLATPTGTFTIRAKRELVRMDNLEHTDVVPYSYDVPLAQYFSDGKALHATLWHDRFGAPASHGCINLSPADAEWLYDFTEAQKGPAHAGTTVRVRGRRPTIAAR